MYVGVFIIAVPMRNNAITVCILADKGRVRIGVIAVTLKLRVAIPVVVDAGGIEPRLGIRTAQQEKRNGEEDKGRAGVLTQ